MNFSLPITTSRVTRNTAQRVNQQIQQQMVQNVERYCGADQETIARRLEELDREWDIERALLTGAPLIVLLSLALGSLVNRRFYIPAGVVAGFLLLHALQGWAPPLPILRRLGFRTEMEIEQERDALRILRGDFHPTSNPRDAIAQARLSLGPSIAGVTISDSK